MFVIHIITRPLVSIAILHAWTCRLFQYAIIVVILMLGQITLLILVYGIPNEVRLLIITFHELQIDFYTKCVTLVVSFWLLLSFRLYH